jgi:hypothetical protein
MKSDLQIQGNLHQNSNNVLHRARRKSPKIHRKAQRPPNSQSNPEKKEWHLISNFTRAIVTNIWY